MLLHVGDDSVRYAPVTRAHRHWVAWLLAIVLHLAVIGLVANWRFAPPPAAERTGLDVVLVAPPAAEETLESDAVSVPEEALGEVAGEAMAEEEAPVEESEATPTDAAPESPDAREPAPLDMPELTARETSETAPTAPPAPAATPSAPAVSAGGTAGEASAPEPAERTRAAQGASQAPPASGRDLLARATSQIRDQGLAPGSAQGGDRSAASRAAEARYIDDWTRRVEDYGNRVHPAPRHLHGQLRIRVVIGSDGGLRLAEVIQSSGHAELDQAALDTIYGAAPYRPFDRDMGELDSLSITRVWRFGQGNHYGVR